MYTDIWLRDLRNFQEGSTKRKYSRNWFPLKKIQCPGENMSEWGRLWAQRITNETNKRWLMWYGHNDKEWTPKDGQIE